MAIEFNTNENVFDILSYDPLFNRVDSKNMATTLAFLDKFKFESYEEKKNFEGMLLSSGKEINQSYVDTQYKILLMKRRMNKKRLLKK